MEEIINAILKIDSDAVKKREDADVSIEEMENSKKEQLLQIKRELSSKSKEEVDNYRELMLEDVKEESERIQREFKKEEDYLDKRYSQFAERISEEAFRMILRSMEG